MDDPSSAFGPEPVDYGGLTLREYQETEYAPWRSVKKPKSWTSEKGFWRRLLEVIGHVPVREIDAHLLADYTDDLMVTRDGVEVAASGATKRLHRQAVQSLLNYAHRQKHIDGRVNLAVFTIEGSTRPARERRAPLSLDELVRLMDASAPKYRAMWAVSAGEGLRPSELRRLRWEDVRWSSKTLVVRGDEDGLGKTELSVAEIPMTPIAFRELRVWWVSRGQPVHGVMFPADEDAEVQLAYESRSAYRVALENAGKRAEIDRPVNMYLLRASFATIAWSLGIEMDVARRILRHADEKMLMSVYCRPRPADLVAKVASFDVPAPGGK